MKLMNEEVNSEPDKTGVEWRTNGFEVNPSLFLSIATHLHFPNRCEGLSRYGPLLTNMS
uniref:XRN_M domain-containing protein n=1 Tax=Heterorhabditis bacteriophora TaxID=37862 RepID=A0A1I7WXA1_HETBA